MYKKDGTLSLWFFLFILCLGFLLLSGRPDISSKEGEGNPMEQREEKVKIFRGKRDLFFKEEPHSPLRESEGQKKICEIGSFQIWLNGKRICPPDLLTFERGRTLFLF